MTFIPYDRVYGLGVEDTLHREPSIEKVRGAIGWQPGLNLERILTDVIDYTRHAPVAAEAEGLPEAQWLATADLQPDLSIAFVDLRSSLSEVQEEILADIADLFDSGQFTSGGR